ncbi:hypothetical protein KTE23_29740 [Burkholderia multivorans]|uniref:hypothetical protein n=1 Tax=Burkholderia multivorans TaxID=87883 RepID=UPI001C229945|nr:hypothetical protein [Burkholderia multivorans]MBU9185748.1 hypothetical protein [Burkholderia multivorans]MBU9284113.1 hypothetical protein [Burkholderia multivorans]MBU9420746.1 hypothetical protein [Burkholderia multivorans]MDN7451288.1 hypothetical protein [Burkholderia multivorans]
MITIAEIRSFDDRCIVGRSGLPGVTSLADSIARFDMRQAETAKGTFLQALELGR